MRRRSSQSHHHASVDVGCQETCGCKGFVWTAAHGGGRTTQETPPVRGHSSSMPMPAGPEPTSDNVVHAVHTESPPRMPHVVVAPCAPSVSEQDRHMLLDAGGRHATILTKCACCLVFCLTDFTTFFFVFYSILPGPESLDRRHPPEYHRKPLQISPPV